MPAEAAVAVSDVEVRTIGKLRRRIIPLLVLLYVVAYVDRINIGFAALTMNAALGITSAQFGLLAGIFFWGYFIFEVPSNLLLHRLGARMWIGRILVTWGIVAMASGAVQNVHQFYVARFLLGVAEAGFFPGIILYLTYWFRQRDQARVISLFVTALPVASILGAPVSGFILDHAHWAGLSSWRWLLILEALPAIVCGVLTCFLLPSRPAEARFLSGFSAAAGIALINSVGNLGGFVGPSVIGAIAKGSTGIYGGLAVAGVALILSAVLVLLLPRRER